MPLDPPSATLFSTVADETVTAPRRRTAAGYLFTSLLQLAWCVILYVASAGPMYWTCYEAYNLHGSKFVAQLYLPLTLACDRWESFGRFMDWYVGLWIL